MQFDYYYGTQAEQFAFYRIPKVLFKDKAFKNISTDAKVLYGLMLDRMGLSMKNHPKHLLKHLKPMAFIGREKHLRGKDL